MSEKSKDHKIDVKEIQTRTNKKKHKNQKRKYHGTVGITNPALDIICKSNVSFHAAQPANNAHACQVLIGTGPTGSRACVSIIVEMEHASATEPLSLKQGEGEEIIDCKISLVHNK